MENKLKKKNIIHLVIFIISAFFVLIGSYFSYNYFLEYRAEKAVEGLNLILAANTDTYDNCEYVLEFDQEILDGNRFYIKDRFSSMYQRCNDIYDLNNIELTEENCTNIIKQSESYFDENYIVYDTLDEKRNLCISEYLTTKFSTGSLYNIENDFKSEINIDFSLDFYVDAGEEGSDEFITNRLDAKKRLKDLVVISPNVEFTTDDIILYKNNGILNLSLKPLTEYTISIKNFKTSIGEETKNKDFVFSTPENKYLGLKILDKVSLYQSNNPPRFQLLEYNTSRASSKVKICEVSNEIYAKIEIFRKKAETQDVNDFFLNEIDKLENINCKEKNIDFADMKGTDEDGEKTLVKKDFNFDDLIGEESKTGLYYVQFTDKEDRNYFNKMSYPIFFGIVDSHITMKNSRNGDTFFFVNDFDGNPLVNQEIKIYPNDFVEYERNWNREKREYDIKNNSILDTSIFSTPIFLGKTGDDGILKVNLKDKIDNAFAKTFANEWDYNRNGSYSSFFVTSNSDTNLSFLNSTWNSGIAPWNFGYKVTSGYWNSTDSDQNTISLNKWGSVEPEYYSHIYTDRLLYLPGETVNIKSVIRNSFDLSIPEGKIIELFVNDSKGNEVYNQDISISDYGSIGANFLIKEDANLGNYSINLKLDGASIAYGGFSVEVFKNPKFKNEILLETVGLNEGLVDIESKEVKKQYYYDQLVYKGNFDIKGSIFAKYYNGSAVRNSDFTYKIYKQYYYENSYWDNCFYGCYWEPRKEFYSEGKGKLDANGYGTFDVKVDFESSYSDYKYIAEVTITDTAGDVISGSNSVIAKLPNEYKKYNNDLSVVFKSDTKFVKSGDTITISGGLNVGKWTTDYNDKYVLVIKKKEYTNSEVDDVRGYTRTVTKVNEKIQNILPINDSNFVFNSDGTLTLNYKLPETGEYVFEYGKIKNNNGYDSLKVLKDFDLLKITEDEIEIEKEVKVCEQLINKCDEDNNNLEEECIPTINKQECNIVIKKDKESVILSDLYTDKNFFSIMTYGDKNALNPIYNDNKINVVPEKITYNLGETAKVLIRLPFSEGKILWTIEKQGVLEHEYIDIDSNVFFKEIEVDDTFVPNAYIGVVAIEVNGDDVPEYKVGYSEIVVDKTDKKAFIDIKSDKETYKPRDTVNLDINVKDKKGLASESELTVMVVDDSLISLLGNVDLNILEKFYKKLPFQIQTSITNIAMLRNYYFSRPGIVGGSGAESFKGGDSAVSSRNIFKNTAYYNSSVITDKYGKAKVSFELPDNLTNFRVMVISNSKDNIFGYSEEFIEVRQNIIIEDKTPLILRDGDVSVIGANVFNNTENSIDFDIKLTASVDIAEPVRKIIIPAGENKYVSWAIKSNSLNKDITYKISALGDTVDNSDKIENTINFQESPILVQNYFRNVSTEGGDVTPFNFNFPENIDIEKTEVEILISNNKLYGIEKIVTSLAKYPYGCIEQTTSSTLPNVILKKFNDILSGVLEDEESIDTNIKVGIDRIVSMQTKDGGFGYWPGNTNSNLHITPYVVRSLIDMKEAGTELPNGLLENSIEYLENNFKQSNISDLEKVEIFWTLAKAGKNPELNIDSSNLYRHSLISYTYGLILKDEKNIELIDENIELIKTKIDEQSHIRYRNNLSDKAIFVSMLIDYDYSISYIDELIEVLFDYDWSSYYYSTQSKNNAFISFMKYINKYSSENHTKFTFIAGNFSPKSLLEVGGEFDNAYKQTFKLSDIVKEDGKLGFMISNLQGSKIYSNIVIKAYPKTKTLIKAKSDGITLSKKIYEVIDESKIDECGGTYYLAKSSVDCSKVLREVTDNVFNLGALYKTIISVELEDKSDNTNLIIEDYLPGAFSVLNSKFKINQIGVSNGTKNGRSWSYKEYRPDVVMATASYVYGSGSDFEYFFRPEFKGVYVDPPTVSYLMYNPQVKANTEFRVVEVK